MVSIKLLVHGLRDQNAERVEQETKNGRIVLPPRYYLMQVVMRN